MVLRKEIELFGQKEYAYIYVDQYNALKCFSDYLSEHEDEYAELKVKDKDWMTVKFGYFVLVSNLDLSPKDLLTEYFGRTDILGVTRQTIIVIENNKYDPTLELAMKISEYFEISVNEIFSLK